MPRKLRRHRRASNPQDLFGTVLRELRIEHRLSQHAFAHKTGYHRNYIGQLERGEKSPSLNALFDFSKSFGLRPSELLQRMESLTTSQRRASSNK